MPAEITPEQRERAIGRRFFEALKALSNDNLELAATRLECRTSNLFNICNGVKVLNFGLWVNAYRHFNLSPYFLNDGTGDRYWEPTRGLLWLEWITDQTIPFSAGFDKYLAPLPAYAAESGQCPFALFEGIDRAKAALASGEMTEEQQAALRDVVAPWLK